MSSDFRYFREPVRSTQCSVGSSFCSKLKWILMQLVIVATNKRNQGVNADIRTIQFRRKEYVKGLSSSRTPRRCVERGGVRCSGAPTQPCTTPLDNETSRRRCPPSSEMKIWKSNSRCFINCWFTWTLLSWRLLCYLMLCEQRRQN